MEEGINIENNEFLSDLSNLYNINLKNCFNKHMSNWMDIKTL